MPTLVLVEVLYSMFRKHLKKRLLTGFLTTFLVLSSSCAYFSGTTCTSCDEDKKAWKNSSLLNLEGTWRGTEEVHRKGVLSSNEKKEVELSFLSGKKFLRLYNFSSKQCHSFLEESIIVLSDILPHKPGKVYQQVFEVFGHGKKDNISFGKVYIHKLEKENTTEPVFSCHYTEIAKINKNRLSLPSVNYSLLETIEPKRIIASYGKNRKSYIDTETIVHFDFFRFENKTLNKKEKDRKIATEKNFPPLFFQILNSTYEITENYGKKSWLGSEKRIFKLWPVD